MSYMKKEDALAKLANYLNFASQVLARQVAHTGMQVKGAWEFDYMGTVYRITRKKVAQVHRGTIVGISHY